MHSHPRSLEAGTWSEMHSECHRPPGMPRFAGAFRTPIGIRCAVSTSIAAADTLGGRGSGPDGDE
jgi:hypothetical protein